MIKYHQIPMDCIVQMTEHFIKDLKETIYSEFADEYVEEKDGKEFVNLVEFFGVEDYEYKEKNVLLKGDIDRVLEEGSQYDGRIFINLCGENFTNNIASANADYEHLWDIVYTHILGIIAHEWCHMLDNESDVVPHSADDETYLRSPREMNAHAIQQLAMNEYGKIDLDYCPDRYYVAIDEYWDLIRKLR